MNLQTSLVSSLLFLCFSVSFAQNNIDSTVLNYDSLTTKISAQQVQYKTLSARTKMIWNDGDVEQEFTGSIRVKKDSLIWLSLGMMGFEGVRVLITPDSFHLINRLTNEYSVRDFSFLQGWLLFPVNFKMLQEIIAGEKISIEERATTAGTEDSSTVLYLESDKVLEKIWVSTLGIDDWKDGLSVEFYTINKILLKDKLLKQDLAITFDAYNYSEAKPFSYKRSIAMNRNGDAAKLNMDILKINFDEPLTFPFEVSEKFKRVE